MSEPAVSGDSAHSSRESLGIRTASARVCEHGCLGRRRASTAGGPQTGRLMSRRKHLVVGERSCGDGVLASQNIVMPVPSGDVSPADLEAT